MTLNVAASLITKFAFLFFSFLFILLLSVLLSSPLYWLLLSFFFFFSFFLFIIVWSQSTKLGYQISMWSLWDRESGERVSGGDTREVDLFIKTRYGLGIADKGEKQKQRRHSKEDQMGWKSVHPEKKARL